MFKSGDKVRIVKKIEEIGDRNCYWDQDGHMDKLIGKIRTVSNVSNVKDKIVQIIQEQGDVCHWSFLEECLELVKPPQLKSLLMEDLQCGDLAIVKTGEYAGTIIAIARYENDELQAQMIGELGFWRGISENKEEVIKITQEVIDATK